MSSRLLSSRADLWAACALVALALVFWSPWLLRGQAPVPADQQSWMLPWVASQEPVRNPAQWDALWWDGVAQFYPWRVQLHRSLSRGEWPLWNPAQFCGYPFIGNGQSAMLYPPNWLYAVLDARRGLAASAAVHFCLALLLTFLYARTIGLVLWAAMVSAVAFSFGGFMIGWVPLPTLMNCAAWLPGGLLGVELTFRRRTPVGTAVLGLSTGMTLLAGHLQIAAYVLLAVVLYAVLRLALQVSRNRTGGRPQPLPWLPLVAGLALGLALGAAQVLPTLELGQQSPRGAGAATHEGLQFHLEGALKPAELLTLLLPDALGNPARGDYLGATVARGAAYGERCGYVGLLAALLALFGLVAGKTRWRWGFAVAAGLTLWAAMGGLPARLLYFGIPKLGLAGGFPRLLCLYTFAVAVLAGVGLQALLRLSGRATGSLSGLARLVGPVALLLLVLDLFTWGWRTLPSVPGARLYPDTEVTRKLQQLRQPGDRMLAVTERSHWGLVQRPDAVLPPNSAAAYEGLESIDGYDSLFPARYRSFAVRLENEGRRSPTDVAPLANGNMILLENTTSPLLSLLGVRWVATPDEGQVATSEDGWFRADGLLVRENPHAFSRAFLTDPQLLGKGDVLQRLAYGSPALRQTVPFASLGQCNRYDLALPARDRSKVLIVTNTAYPGWQAWVGGVRMPVMTVGETFQGVAVSAGPACRALLAFVPSTVTAGLFLMLLGSAALVGLGSFSFLQRRRSGGDARC